ncbi:MAG: serine/threonine-protein kinase, partial [Pseudomonadota bacterium]
MDCLEEGTVLAFVGGQLQGAALASVEGHLVGCPACAALVAVAAPIAPAGPPGGTRRLDAVKVGRYQLRRLVGRGAMGEVYAGYDPELDRKVAIKILRTDVRNADPNRARFMREAQAVARLYHPNVVGIFDVGAAGDRIFLAMELIEGDTLGAWLSRRPRDVSEILRVFALAGRGLQAAHAAGIIHRDFKPQNVMVGHDGSPRVMDFGLAASAEPAAPDQPPLTAAGAILGTPHYMSPEQLRGQRADGRADQFSFCVALWEALHGALPFPAKTWKDLRSAVFDGTPRPGPLARRVPRHVQAALLRGLAVDRARRFPAMTHLLDALSPRRAPAWRRVAAAGGAAIAMAALVAGALLGTRPSLQWGGVTVDLAPVGPAPALPTQQPDGTPAAPTVVVDRAALTAVVRAVAAARAAQTDSEPVGTDQPVADPDTVWAVGAGAAAAARGVAEPAGTDVLSRAQWLADRRSDALSGGLLALLALVAAVCAALAAVVVVLDAAATAPARARSLATARVLGLRPRAAVRVAAGELLPSTLVGAIGGVLLGVVLVGAIVAPLALRLVTGQSSDPGVVVPWWAAVPVALLVATVLVVVAVESSVRRRERLGQVLR